MSDIPNDSILGKLSPDEERKFNECLKSLHNVIARYPRTEKMYSTLIGTENAAEVSFAQRPTKADLDALIKFLQLARETAPAADPSNVASGDCRE